MSTFGFVTMAFGQKKYYDQAKMLAKSLRLNMPGYQIAIICDTDDIVSEFDVQVKMDQYESAGTFLKTEIYKKSPFDSTFFIDSDSLVCRNFEKELHEISNFDFSPVVGTFLTRADSDLWLESVDRALAWVNADLFPKFNGGVYFF